MSQSLPLRANLDWLKKLCKERLETLRREAPATKLSDVQLAVAREYGFPSWRKLKAHVEQLRDTLEALSPADSAAIAVPPDDPELAQLMSAIVAGDEATVTRLLTSRPELSRARDSEGQTPLHAAARFDDPKLGLILMACGADVNATYGHSGHTPLSWAVTCGSFGFARALIRVGVKPDLFCAAGCGALDSVRAWFDPDGQLLPYASKTGSTRFTADETVLPCPPETPREQISDALYIACRNAQADVVEFLLTKDPDLSFRAYLGATALHWAHFGGSSAVIAALERAGANPTSRDDAHHLTPRAFGICVPANWGIVHHVRARLAADLTLANVQDAGTTPLHEAASMGHAEIVRLLLAAGADAQIRNAAGKTALEVATQSGHETVMALLRQES